VVLAIGLRVLTGPRRLHATRACPPTCLSPDPSLEKFLVPSRFSISTATVVMLVLLRLNIGWHFFSEGVKHYADPQWTSEPVLRNAKGPLAPVYQAYLPDVHGFERHLHADTKQTPEHAVTAWLDQIQTDWHEYEQQFAAHYDLSASQRKQAERIVQQYQAKVRNWGEENKESLGTHVHEYRRKLAGAEAPARSVPFQKGRIVAKQSQLAGEASTWLAAVKTFERDYHNALDGVLNNEQREITQMARPRTSIDAVDAVMTYVILAVGVLLLLGLFTRSACVVGAGFLLSVVMMQPFWISETAPTFNQYVEMFALLTLATTEVGRWAGLDYFVSRWFSHRTVKGTSDVSAS
jgi:uncharacterized membrane protein YphA (DoxX/SURF4 family)